MAIRRDPEHAEKTALLALVADWRGKRVLEVGCGNGRLTWRYAHLAGHVDGIDPAHTLIQQAIAATPDALRERVAFWPSGIESFHSPTRYDIAILSWSL